ncbi:hypothetical protein AHMF7605_03555 [Adhaeribacter arboris]|uniref:Beta-lactamase-inhibitor-like PepSY-like domain-containing protein n=1 Tax=Adhaeribacter arboris TaxID=2072846 RepID=A0A2T2YAX2_9BACT|nr:hypothetical protein [Adhaeribacter arboris]PSR52665.1 hypothetical protein AHMF7605_03555 [Adhaeribacter arboris]
MKSFVFTLAFFLTLSLRTLADDPTTTAKLTKVTETVQSKFAQGFAGAENVTWEITDKFQKAFFKKNGIYFTAFYNLKDEFVATTHHVTWNALPLKSLHRIGKIYRGYRIKSVIQYTNQEKVYFVNLEKKNKQLLVQVQPDQNVTLFKRLQ